MRPHSARPQHLHRRRTDGASSQFRGRPGTYISLLDAQKLQFDLAPPAVRVELARGGDGEGRDTVNTVVARLQPNASPDAVAETISRWKHLAALTQEAQENILTRSLVDRARRQIGLFTSLLLTVSAVIIALIIYTMTMGWKLSLATALPGKVVPGRVIMASGSTPGLAGRVRLGHGHKAWTGRTHRDAQYRRSSLRQAPSPRPSGRSAVGALVRPHRPRPGATPAQGLGRIL